MIDNSSQQALILSAGTILDDRFEIIDYLGGGGFGQVYHAKQLVFGNKFREVAVKLFKTGLITNANAFEVFNDAVALLRMQEESPSAEVADHIIKVYDIGVLTTPAKQAFMSMELIKGKKTLRNVIRLYQNAGGMPLNLTMHYLRQILIPLAWMHTFDIAMVHGDLKPENILIAKPNTANIAILTDFGLAARLPLGSMGGTLQYQAPESLSGEPGLTPAEVYSIGIIWYEMITGTNPFANVGLEAVGMNDNKALIYAHQQARKWEIKKEIPGANNLNQNRIPPASEFNEEFREHPQLEILLNKCLSYQQSNRFPNLRILLQKIDEYCSKGSITNLESLSAPKNEAVSEKLSGKTPEAIINDAGALIIQKEFKRAIAIVDGLLNKEPQNISALLVKARCLALTKDFINAEKLCETVKKQAPGDPRVLEGIADVLDAEGKTNLAGSLRLSAQKMKKRQAGRSFP